MYYNYVARTAWHGKKCARRDEIQLAGVYRDDPGEDVYRSERLAEVFTGFDSIDERMKRIPNDLNDSEYREQYVRHHIEWFLKNHPDAVDDFMDEVRRIYGGKRTDAGQLTLFDLFRAPVQAGNM